MKDGTGLLALGCGAALAGLLAIEMYVGARLLDAILYVVSLTLNFM